MMGNDGVGILYEQFFMANKQKVFMEIRKAAASDLEDLIPLFYELDSFHYLQNKEVYRTPEEINEMRIKKDIYISCIHLVNLQPL